ncbi:hypothetical protein DL771_000534 [Monosporascus sp. 5C6A]|nr:hypothetical protein DL771_000534 [Monosporascus sp. 5C6A]
MRFSIALARLALAVGIASAVSTFRPARPPSIPLAVKSPYLNSWLNAGSDGGNGGYLAGEWPRFWAQQITGWMGFIRVDGVPYAWLGAGPGAALVDQTDFSYTSTRSTFILNAGGKVEMNVTFLSPVTANDLRRQSLTFSYLDVGVHSLDGAGHDVQLYVDVSAGKSIVQWDYDTADGVAYHQFARQEQVEIQEVNQQASWGTWYWSTKDDKGLTWQSGSDTDVRGNFVRDGVLTNTKDTDFRPVNQNWPVFGFAKDIGSVNGNTISTVFSIGLTQDAAIKLLGEGDGLTTYSSLWKSYFQTGLEAMTFFYNDYHEASRIATDLDNKIATNSLAAAGQDYLTITSLSVRQTFGALQFTGTADDPVVFLKEISSNSDIQTVDVIFPAIPLLLYLNPQLVQYLLKPLFLNQENGHYPKRSAIHDLGIFPLAKGYPDGNDEPMPLEECGNMIIMVLAYAQRTGDVDYLEAHYPILKQWAGFLVDESLIPAHQLSTDDFAGMLANQTNLALKGIIGLRAMSEIADLTGHTEDAASFGDTARSYIDQWQDLGINKAADLPHTTLSYGDESSHGLLYNLYANSLLGFGYDFVPKSVYDWQSAFYPTVALKYGVPLDTRHTWTKTDWIMWTAAIASEDTRNTFIRLLARWISETTTHMAFTDLYDAATGDYPSAGLRFTARPVVGGHFALLVLPKK